MKLYRVEQGAIIQDEGKECLLDVDWDDLINRDDLHDHLMKRLEPPALPLADASYMERILAPVASQEVWAAGVTYYRSRDARMAEAREAGANDFYDRVYTAERPELFLKSTPHRVAGPGQAVRIRGDASWNVPEPELALAIASSGKIIGYTIGNDMSSRDIEGQNPLYLPQAKIYDRSCALGPCVFVSEKPLPSTTEISMDIARDGHSTFSGSTTLAQLKRSFESLVDYLYRDNSFPHGCILLTGTGIVPPDDFTLKSGDTISITIEPIGTLVNTVQ
jgi:2-dehydro-3-deoxy-D-arabinonate dehydratase